MTTIGIPRALLYYKYYPLWITFFEEIGCQVVISRNSNKRILDDGVRNTLDEVCLPCKIFTGHTINLIEKGVDYLFIPRMKSVETKKSFTCPRLVGTSDVIYYSLRALNPPTILSPYVETYTHPLIEAYLEVGEALGVEKDRVEKALAKALEVQEKFTHFKKKAPSPHQIMKKLSTVNREFAPANIPPHIEDEGSDGKIKIALVGHSYVIYDPLISMNLIDKLTSMGIEVLTGEMLPEELLMQNYQEILKQMHWTYEKEILGAANYYLKDDQIRGLIYMSTFACGPASLVGEAILRQARKHQDKSFLALVVDEHTGEAGVMTRIEAFVDMIKRKEGAAHGN
ncbi:hypothetical protein HKBW3S03_00916 [Candidatus Hakubella thermalkaliphila]|uniref:DUF2229 domain-containing protein n=3 Tax=Candidatus Hakubella thermalkaliphila TaxID=2754717 RepID=A0A6V8Q470_9ACTN|nr:acyl-CoA dehydratase activase-related protein [Candidatus Hakubella thermalkaliphila]GFP19411.1 hypothetical protein HKBW3S03_00916 [Candidatus Hakubella thermalkaliphila]GFP29899.1 hypothetical protein HKBW3S34_00819 [Candidatus Hakubella thermalkaliphila]GFP37182.1 hypothetical protein HKBW3S44_00862 [Candidatus Hakubella thermalkaliphila]GFP39572.1 hypothetical protein HKBW3S47_01270 [Candidatus Hakubella thermalkaliphila]